MDNAPIGAYVDIHAHVLPGIDDGPPNLDKSLEMLRAAADSGIATIAATPHLRPDFPEVQVGELADRCAAMRNTIKHQRIPIRLVSGAEVSILWAMEASDEDLRLASYDQRGTDLLIETPQRRLVGFDHFLERLRAKGYRITLAHPERGSEFVRSPELLEQLVAQGTLLQVNADAVVGPKRSPVARLARRLCCDGLAHAIGSDGHRAERWRPVTRLAEAVTALDELVGAERARWMACSVPAAILDGAGVQPAPPTSALARRPRRVFKFRW